jgi:hypothetical protein
MAAGLRFFVTDPTVVPGARVALDPVAGYGP